MTDPRPTPFRHLLAAVAGERFPAVGEALREADVDVRDRDAFLLAPPVAELIRDLRPEEGLGEAIDPFVALIHAAYLHWASGAVDQEVDGSRLAEAIAGSEGTPIPLGTGTPYLQLPPRRLWGTPVEGQPAEPLDGCFVTRVHDQLRVVAAFGFHPARFGLTVVEVAGADPGPLARLDGTPLFASTLSGGSEAGLASVTGMEELLCLVWRLVGTGSRGKEPLT